MNENINELQKKYEKEFSEFLIQKINHAGGSLQFQHLTGFLQQLRFEIRDACGVTKPELMKFLRAHPKTFKINSKGIVTVIRSSTSNSSDCSSDEENQTITSKKTFQPKIISGEGFVFKMFFNYAIIKAIRPIITYVFFTPEDYGAKDSLFTDICLPLQTKVCFNAIHGHNDHEIEYRATKVWCHDYPGDKNSHSENNTRKRFSGEGIIHKLCSTRGFISVAGDVNRTVFFYRNDVKYLNIKLGDHVIFDAEYDSNEWNATKVIKKRKKSINEPSSDSQRFSKTVDENNVANEKINDQSGKIYPNSKGAIIKFGRNYSEIADGDECDFYLLGMKVANSDIAAEFLEGDEVKFDATKSKNSLRWKANLVWNGEKPTATDIKRKIDENCDDTDNNNFNEISSDSSNLLIRPRKNNSSKETNTLNKGHKLNSKSQVQFDRPSSKNLKSSSVEKCYTNNIVTSKMSQKLSHKSIKYSKSKSRHNNKKFVNIHNQKKLFPITKIDNFEENYEKSRIFKDLYAGISESSETTSEENNELQDIPYCSRKFLKEDEQCLNETRYLQENLKNETYSDKESDGRESEDGGTFSKRKSCIKIFEAIDGEIALLQCRFAFIKSSQLKRDVDFLLDVFHLNGKPVEEQQISNLKEVLNVGDNVKFNCFEIIDDFGEVHQKVTMVWKGLRPSSIEIKPEEFILKNELCVTADDKLDNKCESDESFDSTKSINFNNTPELNSEAEPFLYKNLGDTSYEYPIILESEISNTDEYGLSDVDVQHEKLSDKILQKLKTYGFISSEPEVAMNGIQEIIDLVLKNSNIEESFNSSLYQHVIKSASVNMCSSCAKTNKRFINEVITKDSETQTIATGEIYLTSTFTED